MRVLAYAAQFHSFTAGKMDNPQQGPAVTRLLGTGCCFHCAVEEGKHRQIGVGILSGGMKGLGVFADLKGLTQAPLRDQGLLADLG
jgi:hypothetical protein